MSEPRYTVARAGRAPEMNGLWRGPTWRDVPALVVGHYRPEGSAHRPRAACKLLYDSRALYAFFRVEDRYVRSVRTNFQDPVYRDSCVELFLKPKDDAGYFNLEFNSGGILLASYISDPTRVAGGFRKSVPLGPDDDRRICRFHSLPSVVEPEIVEPTTWYLEIAVPFAVLAKYTGPIGPVEGRSWRANVYKCGDETSHPHWASWAPVDKLDFHVPERFGSLHFAPEAGGSAA